MLSLRHSAFFALLFGGSVAATAATGPDARELLRSLSGPSTSAWVAADFDGNRTIDFALASESPRDARGDVQMVSVHLGGKPRTFAFHNRTGRVLLDARDIDGDRDRDIVIREALSLVPIAVWINDGAGNFKEGDLEDYAGLDSRGSGSFESREAGDRAFFAVLAERVQPAVLQTSLSEPLYPMEDLIPLARDFQTCFRGCDLRSRAPPRNS